MRSLSVIARWTYGRGPGPQDINGCELDKYKARNAWVPNKTHASAWLPYIQRAPFSGGVRSKFWTCTKLSAGLNGPRLIRSAFTEWETDIAEWETDKKCMLTETNGLKILFSVGRPLRYMVRCDWGFMFDLPSGHPYSILVGRFCLKIHTLIWWGKK